MRQQVSDVLDGLADLEPKVQAIKRM